MSTNMDAFMNKAREMACAAGKVAGEVVDTSKAKLQEMKLNADLKDAYARLGNVVYDSIKKDSDNRQLIDMIVGEIDTLKKELQETQPVQSEDPGEIYCPKCGATNEKGFSFCCKCGTALTAERPEQPESPVGE